MENINRLYLLNTDRFNDPIVFDDAYAQMDPERQKKIDAFKFPKDKKLSLGAGFLLKNALSEIGINDFSIEKRERGKPYLTGHEDIFFNLSHSGNMVLLGLSGKEIGVDIEAEKEFKDSLINYVFCDDEKSLAKELTKSLNLSPDQVYTRLWTAKESVMKYCGMGIALEPKKIHLFIREDSQNRDSILGAASEVFDCSFLTLICASIAGYQFTTCSGYHSFNLSEI